jgi:hypothetical protein
MFYHLIEGKKINSFDLKMILLFLRQKFVNMNRILTKSLLNMEYLIDYYLKSLITI